MADIDCCPQCGETGRFGVARSRASGRSGWCLRCRADAQRAVRERDPEKHRAEARRRYRAAPEKWKAKVALRRAVAGGKIKRPSRCADCQTRGKVEAHHWRGYERRHWLTVVWLCRSCHHLRHKTHHTPREIAA